MEGVTEIYDAACEAGIHVVVSAGNEAFTGNHSLWGGDMVKTSSVSTGTVGMPGSFDSVLTVASVENSHVLNSNAAWGDYLMYTDSYGNSNTFAYQEKEDVAGGENPAGAVRRTGVLLRNQLGRCRGQAAFCRGLQAEMPLGWLPRRRKPAPWAWFCMHLLWTCSTATSIIRDPL